MRHLKIMFQNGGHTPSTDDKSCTMVLDDNEAVSIAFVGCVFTNGIASGGLRMDNQAQEPIWWTELDALFSDKTQVVRSTSIRDGHGRDFSYHHPHLPDAVVYPTCRDDVVTVMKFAHQHQIPIVPFGIGSSLEGHTIPLEGGISLDLTRMNRIIDFRPQDFIARVEPGITRVQLNDTIQRYGVFFPVDPGAEATIGGMAATNASGTTAVRYGAMRDQVKGLEVVLADGTVIHTGSQTMKSSAGYNLTSLFVGSEGTLGVITEVTLRLQPIPEAIIAARAVFPDIDSAGEAAASVISSGIAIGRIELVDAGTIHAVNVFKETTYEEEPTLFLEFTGTETSVRHDIEIVQELCEDEGCASFVFETEGTARAKLWEARHSTAMALMAMSPGLKHMSTDVCVPISQLPGALKHARMTIDKYGVDGVILGHVGDGNYHAGFMVNPDDEADMARLYAINEEIVTYALERGGTCTGEHGVGLGKMKYLEREHGASSVALMRTIKCTFDPLNILNPGKVITVRTD